MKRTRLDDRKRFAAELRARDAGELCQSSDPQKRRKGERMLLLARASVARRLVREGVVDGELALSFAVWPTSGIQRREDMVSYGTLTGRAFGQRGNQ
ncbi:MAG: hypothetical protein ACJ768_12750 [Gaiellaceae bacterium]